MRKSENIIKCTYAAQIYLINVSQIVDFVLSLEMGKVDPVLHSSDTSVIWEFLRQENSLESGRSIIENGEPRAPEEILLLVVVRFNELPINQPVECPTHHGRFHNFFQESSFFVSPLGRRDLFFLTVAFKIVVQSLESADGRFRVELWFDFKQSEIEGKI